MQTPSSWRDTSAGGGHERDNTATNIPQAVSAPSSRQTAGDNSAFMKYMRPVGPPVPGCYMGHRSPCGGQYRMPHPRHPHCHMYYPGHVPMMPMYYPHGPHRLPPHMMHPYRHHHMGYAPMPPYPPYYPYPGSRYGSPRSAFPSTYSWNEYKCARPIPPGHTPTSSCRSHSPRCSAAEEDAKSSDHEERVGNRTSTKRRTASFGSDSPFSDDEFGAFTEEQSKRRSKYRTLLRELAVNDSPLQVFNNNVKPQTLRQAICMYIDYLAVLNENRVRVEEFNTAPLMEPGFEFEDYYHEALNEDVHFPSGMFKDWLAGYGVSIEVTDDPDGTDPGEKIVVITNLGNPKPVMGNVPSQDDVAKDFQTSESMSPCVDPASMSQDTNPIAPQVQAVSTSMHDAFSAVNKPTETIDEGCVITLIEDDEGSQMVRSGHLDSGSGLENTYSSVLESSNANTGGKNRAMKRKSRYDSPDVYAMDNYLPPRKSCIDKREKGNAKTSTGRRRSKNSTPVQDNYQHQTFMCVNQTSAPVQDGTSYLSDAAYFGDNVVLSGSSSACQALPVDGSSFLCNPQNNLNYIPESVTSTLATDNVQPNNVNMNDGIVSCQPFQHTEDPNFISYNADFQRELHTPIFDEVGNTPTKKYGYPVQEHQSGHIKMNDPVLIETAGKRRKVSAGVNDFISDDSSRDTTGSGDLDGIHVLSPLIGMKRSPMIQPKLHFQRTMAKDNQPMASAVGMEFPSPFKSDDLVWQVRDAMANVGVLAEDSLGQNQDNGQT